MNASGVAADFRSMQRLGSASFVMMFMSRAMAEQLRYGNNECIAVAKSATLRTVVMLDDYVPSKSSFAAATPDRIVYRPENDAPFWLYAYSTDHFERCRGSWPSKKLLLREPRFSDVETDQLFDEYSRLETILGTVSKPEPAPAPEPEPINFEPVDLELAAAPAPVETEQPAKQRISQPEDRFFYVPLAIIPIEKNEAERNYAELSEIISAEPEQTAEQPEPLKEAEPEQPSSVFAAYASAVGGKKSEPVYTKAEGKVTETSYFDPETDRSQVVFEEIMPKPIFVPDPEQEEPAFEPAPAPESEPVVEAVQEEAPQIEESTCKPAEQTNENVSVKIVVRKPRRRKVSVKPLAEREEEEAAEASKTKIINATIPFEKYIRSIALSAVESERERLIAEARPEPARGISLRRSKVQPVEITPIAKTNAAPAVSAPRPEPVPTSAAPAQESAEGEKASPRKNKFPHIKGALAGVIAALRSERAARAEEREESEAEQGSEPEGESFLAAVEPLNEVSPVPAAAKTAVAQKQPKKAVEEEDALRAAVNKFLELDSDESIYV